MKRAPSRMSMRTCVVVFFILCSNMQTFAGDVFPIQAVEGLWSQDAPERDFPFDLDSNNFTLFDDTQNDQDIAWFKTKIVDKYGFVKDKALDIWEQQGKFGSVLGSPDFIKAAERVLQFFKRNSDWSSTKSNKKFRDPTNGKCLQLLYITAARYLLVTHILWDLSDKKLIPCEDNNKVVSIPSSICYPEPYGSATCTSDYDVGLVGKDAGFLTEKFNNYFESSSGFGKPSEKVFDTNVYAFTLEYAVSKYFTGLPNKFAASVAAAEDTLNFKMQELVSSYYKVAKYNEGFSDQLLATAKISLGSNVVKHFNKWNKKVQRYDRKVKLTGDDIRQAHNAQYQALVKSISMTGGYTQPEKNIETLGQALLYAAEAYHTRGAIRHVVGNVQLGLSTYHPTKLSLMDLWVSMIENWGESLKEYGHSCFDAGRNPVPLEICVLKMSKYLWRMVAAMKILKERLEKHKNEAPKGASINPTSSSLVRFEGGINPERLMKTWYEEYKKKGEIKIPSTQLDITAFFARSFGCSYVIAKNPLPAKCLNIMNGRIDEYNRKVAELFSKLHPIGPSDQESDGDLLSLKRFILKRPF